MPDVPGGYQPDTKSESARRADFDLLRRVNRAQRAVDDLGTANPANALGVVAIGAGVINSGSSFNLTTGSQQILTVPLAFKPLLGRRYRLCFVAGTWTATATTSMFIYPYRDAAIMGGDRYSQWVTGAVASRAEGLWLFDGDGVQHNFTVRAYTGATGSLTNVATSVSFYIEDVGPNAAPALPVPETPQAWTAVTTYANGFTAPADLNSYHPVRYRKMGDIVYVSGGMDNPGAAVTTTAFTLPVGFRPLRQMGFPVIGWLDTAYLTIAPTGAASVVSGNTRFIDIEIQYSVTP